MDGRWRPFQPHTTMPARPLSDETLHLIAAVQDALAERLDARAHVEERPLFGSHAFMVDGKLCLAVKGDELLVRLPPQQHASTAETPGLRELAPRGGMAGYFWVTPAAYATRAQWRHWIDAALAYNPQARATPRRRSGASSPDRKPPRPQISSVFGPERPPGKRQKLPKP